MLNSVSISKEPCLTPLVTGNVSGKSPLFIIWAINWCIILMTLASQSEDKCHAPNCPVKVQCGINYLCWGKPWKLLICPHITGCTIFRSENIDYMFHTQITRESSMFKWISKGEEREALHWPSVRKSPKSYFLCYCMPERFGMLCQNVKLLTYELPK